MGGLFESVLSTPEASETLGDLHVVDCMLRIEAALARAQARVGLIPQEAAQSIIGTCKVELFDVPRLVRESARTRCLATPLVASLRETVALFNPEAARYVHLGCSDHDLVNTALSLVKRDVLKLIAVDLCSTLDTLLAWAVRHADDPIVLRTPYQSSGITSFGLICCQWATPLVRADQRLQSAMSTLPLDLGSDLLCLQDMQGKASLVTALMAADLQLQAPDVAGAGCHDSLALACELGLLVGSLGKMVADIRHLMQFEIGELVPISLLKNPATGDKSVSTTAVALHCRVAHTAAQSVPQQVASLLATLSQDNSQTPGSWQTRLALWPDLLTASHSITQAVAQLTAGLKADTQRMRSNLETARADLSAVDARTRFSAELMQHASALTRKQIAALCSCRAQVSIPQD